MRTICSSGKFNCKYRLNNWSCTKLMAPITSCKLNCLSFKRKIKSFGPILSKLQQFEVLLPHTNLIQVWGRQKKILIQISDNFFFCRYGPDFCTELFLILNSRHTLILINSFCKTLSAYCYSVAVKFLFERISRINLSNCERCVVVANSTVNIA